MLPKHSPVANVSMHKKKSCAHGWCVTAAATAPLYGNSFMLTGLCCWRLSRRVLSGLLIRRVWEAAKWNMSTDMPPGSINLESQLLSIMDVLVKTAVTEISQLFSENSASLCIQLTQSLRENEAMRKRMSAMRSELFSLRLQTRNNRPASRFSQLKGNVPKPRAKPKGEEHFKF